MTTKKWATIQIGCFVLYVDTEYLLAHLKIIF